MIPNSYVFWAALSVVLVRVASYITVSQPTVPVLLCTSYEACDVLYSAPGCPKYGTHVRYDLPYGLLMTVNSRDVDDVQYWTETTRSSTRRYATRSVIGRTYTNLKQSPPCGSDTYLTNIGYYCSTSDHLYILVDTTTIYYYPSFATEKSISTTVTRSSIITLTASFTESTTESVIRSFTEILTESFTKSVTKAVTKLVTKSVCKGEDGLMTIYTPGPTAGRSTTTECLSSS